MLKKFFKHIIYVGLFGLLCFTLNGQNNEKLPTIVAATKTALPNNRKYDGFNLLSLISGNEIHSPRKEFAYYNGLTLKAVRQGKWKLHLPRNPELSNSTVYWVKKRNKKIATPILNNLNDDNTEKKVVVNVNKINQLEKLTKKYREELGDWNRLGINFLSTTYPGNLNTRELTKKQKEDEN